MTDDPHDFMPPTCPAMEAHFGAEPAEVEHPMFDTFLSQVTEEPAVRSHLKRWVDYLMTTREPSFLVPHFEPDFGLVGIAGCHD